MTWTARYRVVSTIGQGASGVVYRAIQEPLGRAVAIKRLHVSLAGDEELIARFRREVAVCRRLVHPHVIKVLDAGESDGKPYLVMELLDDATTLLAWISRHAPCPAGKAFGVVRQLLDALAYCHAQGLVHRDVKPANILLRSGEDVVLADFGLVKVAGSTLLTLPGEIMGTLRYMAPETLVSAQIGPLADLWAAGVILYELLTGRSPFRADTPVATTRCILKEEPRLVSSYRSDLPRSIDDLLGRFLCKDPVRRVPSAREGIALLDEWLTANSTSAPPVLRGDASCGEAPQCVDGGIWDLPTVRNARERGIALDTPLRVVPAPEGTRPGARIRQRTESRWRAISVVAGAAAILGGLLAWPTAPHPRQEASSPVSIIPSAGPPSNAASGNARSDVWCTLRLKAALRSLSPLALQDQMVRDFAGASLRARAGHALPSPDSMRARWSARLDDRLRDLRMEEISRRFGATKDRAYRSNELDPATKADLYADVQALAELEETAGLLGIQHARVSDLLQSAEYGPIDPPGISNPSGYGLRSADGQAPAAGGVRSVEGVQWQRFSKAALDVMQVLQLKTSFDIRQPPTDRSLLELVAVPAYVHPDCVWHPPQRSPIRAQIRAMWGPPEAALRVLVAPRPAPGRADWRLLAVLEHRRGPNGPAICAVPADVMPEFPAYVRIELAYSPARAHALGEAWQEAYVDWLALEYQAAGPGPGDATGEHAAPGVARPSEPPRMFTGRTAQSESPSDH